MMSNLYVFMDFLIMQPIYNTFPPWSDIMQYIILILLHLLLIHGIKRGLI